MVFTANHVRLQRTISEGKAVLFCTVPLQTYKTEYSINFPDLQIFTWY